jgi:hypothetical protein
MLFAKCQDAPYGFRGRKTLVGAHGSEVGGPPGLVLARWKGGSVRQTRLMRLEPTAADPCFDNQRNSHG